MYVTEGGQPGPVLVCEPPPPPPFQPSPLNCRLVCSGTGSSCPLPAPRDVRTPGSTNQTYSFSLYGTPHTLPATSLPDTLCLLLCAARRFVALLRGRSPLVPLMGTHPGQSHNFDGCLSPASTITERTPPAKRTPPATGKERAMRMHDPWSGGAQGVDGRYNARRSRVPGPHAHGNAVRQVVDDR